MFYILELAATKFEQAMKIAFDYLNATTFRRIDKPGLPPRTMKNIVILGGSYAGVSTAHRIFKQTAKARNSFKITLVSPDTHFYWSMASPRGLVPGQLTDEDLFQPIAAGFTQYPARQFEFVLASAKSLNVEARNVKISLSGSTAGYEKKLDYDFLILATGSHAREGTPFKGLGSTKATKDALHDFQARVQRAQTIVVAGAGVTGVETAGELAFEYRGQKKIILVRLENHPQNHATTSILATLLFNHKTTL